MGLYLGANALGGGGGSPLGSLSYLIPPTAQSSDSVLELDSGSFLKSGASISTTGSGKYNASAYDSSLLSPGAFIETPSAYSFGDRSDRGGAFWNGTHIITVMYEASGNTVLRALNQSDFSVAYSGNIQGSQWPAAAGIVDGDYLIYAKCWIGSTVNPSSSPEFKRVLKTNLTTAASYGSATSVNSSGSTVDWDAPSGYTSHPLFTACNQGLSSEKHYFANFPGSNGLAYCTIGQFTYNDAAPTSTSPWTATGSTIVLPITTGTRTVSLAGNGNSLYVQTNTNIVYKYNSTTLALEATFQLSGDLSTSWSTNYNRNGVFVIPASDSSTGVDRYFMNTVNQNVSSTPIWDEISFGEGISAPQAFNLETYDGTDITQNNGDPIDGYMKIK